MIENANDVIRKYCGLLELETKVSVLKETLSKLERIEKETPPEDEIFLVEDIKVIKSEIERLSPPTIFKKG